jgi:hypothetical protein
MTIERRIVVGLDDIRAVSFECNKCKTRTTVLSERLTGIPEKCIYCGDTWIAARNPENCVPLDSAYRTFIQSIMKVKTLIENGSPFKILLEFHEPKERE